MAIRLRRVNGRLIALCAARSVPKDGDVYLDDEAHQALSTKFALDFGKHEGWGDIPYDEYESGLIDQEESNNPNREWWDGMYGGGVASP